MKITSKDLLEKTFAPTRQCSIHFRMRVFYDVTKSHRSRHRSGLLRVSRRLREELECHRAINVIEVVWHSGKRYLRDLQSQTVIPNEGDAFVTAELFSEEERPGFREFLQRTPARTLALFHDAIPLRWPEITWPQAVARHPSYMKDLADFDTVAAVSETSAAELAGYWAWLGIRRATPPSVNLGADILNQLRPDSRFESVAIKQLLQVGILEPRKNQELVLQACEALHATGEPFEVTLVGRVNPHFGRPLVRQIRDLKRKGVPIRHLAGADDKTLHSLYQKASLTLCPSIAEGFGLPVLEALWAGCPVLASDIPSHVESSGPGVRLFRSGDRDDFTSALLQLLDRPESLNDMKRAARERELPRWSQTAHQLLELL